MNKTVIYHNRAKDETSEDEKIHIALCQDFCLRTLLSEPIVVLKDQAEILKEQTELKRLIDHVKYGLVNRILVWRLDNLCNRETTSAVKLLNLFMESAEIYVVDTQVYFGPSFRKAQEKHRLSLWDDWTDLIREKTKT